MASPNWNAHDSHPPLVTVSLKAWLLADVQCSAMGPPSGVKKISKEIPSVAIAGAIASARSVYGIFLAMNHVMIYSDSDQLTPKMDNCMVYKLQ
jgi:hypothetical protein